MIKYLTTASIIVILFSSICSGDVFKHRQSGEIFYGYPTNRRLGNKTRVYVEEDGKFKGKTVIIDEYDVTYDAKGRKKNLIVIGIDHQDIILSDTVSIALAKTIEEGANQGPRCIILEIDSPGGRGEYMKKICDAIKKTSNCPVVAFITGNKYGGAFSAAAGIALACDKIYIAPDAQIGTVAAPVETTGLQQDPTDWLDTFTPKSIASFGEYLSTFAEKKNRPAAMVMAMVDQNIEVVEVVTDEHGSRNFVHKGDKKPADAIEKTWSKKSKISPAKQDTEKDDDQQQYIYQLTLSAKDAVDYTKMADKIVSSRSEVIKDLQAEGVKVIVTSRIKFRVRKFAQSRAQLSKYYAAFKELEGQVEDIEKLMKEVSSAALKNRPSKEDERLRRIERKAYENRLQRSTGSRRKLRRRVYGERNGGNLTREEIANLEREMNETYIDPYLLQQRRLAVELAYTLNDLLIYYSRAAKIAKQYPGAMPKGKTLKNLQIKYNSAAAKRNSLGF
ncbi:MAG: hypothetical protein FVQ82_08070 [Planctomycetes bacterium]|nr:hypothetical protein [Planctomycetota bacterium]